MGDTTSSADSLAQALGPRRRHSERKRSGRKRLMQVIRQVLVSAFGFVMIYPILWLVSGSLKPNELIFSEVGLIPRIVTGINYVHGWAGIQGVTFGRFFLNSFAVALLSVAGN